MRLSERYLKRLADYLEWEKCKTPFSGFQAMEADAFSAPETAVAHISPQQWMFEFETYGMHQKGFWVQLDDECVPEEAFCWVLKEPDYLHIFLDRVKRWENKKTAPLVLKRLGIRPKATCGVTVGEHYFSTDWHPGEGCSNPALLARYKRGKAMKDWWTKENGENARIGATFIPEEHLIHLMPDCFFELFGRYPITPIVRQLYDNSYPYEHDDLPSFLGDMHKRELGIDRTQTGWEIIG